jgi:sensor histidine kinase YesM
MRTKILLSFIGCTLLAMVVQTILFQRSSSVIILAQAQEISRNTLNNLQEDLYNFNKSIENSLIKIYNQNAFMRDIAMGHTILDEKHSQIAYDLVHLAFSPSQNLASLYVYTPLHQLVSVYHHAQTPIYSYPEDIYKGKDDYNADVIKQYIRSDERTMLISSYYNPNRKTNIIRYVLKIFRNNSMCSGYMICDVDPKPFLKFMQKYRYSDSQVIWLQPDGDRVALVTGDISADTSNEAGPALRDSESGGEFLRVSRGILKNARNPPPAPGIGDEIIIENGFAIFRSPSYKYNFNAYSLMPQAILGMSQAALVQNEVFVLLFILAGFSLLFLVISNGLTKPLRYMVNTMSRIRRGETDLRLKPMKQNEIGILGREFNDMLDETGRLIRDRYEAKLLVNDARYKALQAQVNPHFLYNTLDTMGGIALAQNCPTVGTLCKALSNIFRYSLNMEDTAAALEDEIRHIKNYMYVMNIRMNGEIRMDYQIDGPLFNALLPRLSIQPLVENAIQHGLKNRRGEKRVQIGARRDGTVLVIWVRDNGVGMDAEEANRRLRSSPGNVPLKGNSIGLDNINTRIRLLYGEAFGVFVESGTGEGCRVSLRLPFIERPAKDE